MRIFGIDPGSLRTGYGCVETDGRQHHLVTCGVLLMPAKTAFPDKLNTIHRGLTRLLAEAAPDCVVIENLFHARNVRSALVLGHARGAASASSRVRPLWMVLSLSGNAVFAGIKRTPHVTR